MGRYWANSAMCLAYPPFISRPQKQGYFYLVHAAYTNVGIKCHVRTSVFLRNDENKQWLLTRLRGRVIALQKDRDRPMTILMYLHPCRDFNMET